MDPRLLRYYNRELQHIREMGGEFAKEYPKVAGRLGLEGFECADPYVERLLESFAFMAARVQLKLDEEFRRFTDHLLETVYPHYLAPLPSMSVVQISPDMEEGDLVEGYPIPRGTALKSRVGPDFPTPCEYRTGSDVTLLPIELVKAEYLSSTGAVAAVEVTDLARVKAAIRLRLRTTGDFPFSDIKLDSLPLFLRGADELPMHIFEQIIGNCSGMVVRPAKRPLPWQRRLPAGSIARKGFENDEALLPYGLQSFHGYRLLQEYFAFPQRFMFVELNDLEPSIRKCDHNELEIIILLNRSDNVLDNSIDANNFALFATPVINLFPMRGDRIHLTPGTWEHHVVPDRTRPLDFEVYQVKRVTGIGAGVESERHFEPFYSYENGLADGSGDAYFTVRRVPRVWSTKMRRVGPKSSHVGNEVYITLVDSQEAPYRHDLKQLALELLCTNRDLPLFMPVGKGTTDFTLDTGAPVENIRVVAGPSKPRASFAYGETAWRLVSHLSLNYLSLLDSDAGRGADALRELLSLYADTADPAITKQIEGVRNVAAKQVVRRVSGSDRLGFGRGLEVSVTMDEEAFEGSGIFLLGAVLERFFSKYASINSFTETVVHSLDRGEVMRWPVRIGQRLTL